MKQAPEKRRGQAAFRVLATILTQSSTEARQRAAGSAVLAQTPEKEKICQQAYLDGTY
ncbi:MAG: hypothetical protein KA271_00440 [Propionivibrio sp.]|nr:hypothetical protein [Propionivibrio sp.]